MTFEVSQLRILVAGVASETILDVKDRLESLGHTVLELVPSRDTAIDSIRKDKPDLVLMNHQWYRDLYGELGDVPVVQVDCSADPTTPAATAVPGTTLILPCTDSELRLTLDFALYDYRMQCTLRGTREMLGQKIAELESSERRYRTLVETPSLGIVLMDRRGRYLYVSPKMEELTGYPLDAFYNEQGIGWRITHPDDHMIGESAFAEAGKGRPVLDQEFRLLHKDGGERWMSGSTFPVRDANERVSAVQVVFTDIDERKQLESQLRQSQKIQALGQLTAGIAHNFNNMLMIIMGNLELALKELPSSRQHYLRIAGSSTKRATDMVRQLMTFSRQGVQSAKAMVSVDLVIRNTVAICTETFDRLIEISFSAADRLPLVWADQNQLEQVVLNLCLNARDALERVTDSPFIAITAAVQEVEPIIAAFQERPKGFNPVGMGFVLHVFAD